MKKQRVTIDVWYDETEYQEPKRWDWTEITDSCGPDQVKVVAAESPQDEAWFEAPQVGDIAEVTWGTGYGAQGQRSIVVVTNLVLDEISNRKFDAEILVHFGARSFKEGEEVIVEERYAYSSSDNSDKVRIIRRKEG